MTVGSKPSAAPTWDRLAAGGRGAGHLLTIMSTTDPAAGSSSSDPLKKAKRQPLIAINRRRAGGEGPAPSAKLDSSLKRHSSLLNRLRKSFSLDTKDAVLKDVEGLTLEKYAEEIVDASLEGVSTLGGKGDILVVAEVRRARFIREDGLEGL